MAFPIIQNQKRFFFFSNRRELCNTLSLMVLETGYFSLCLLPLTMALFAHYQLQAISLFHFLRIFSGLIQTSVLGIKSNPFGNSNIKFAIS